MFDDIHCGWQADRANLRRDGGVPSSGAELPGGESSKAEGSDLRGLIWQVSWAGTTE
jgi:hypothetical protein